MEVAASVVGLLAVGAKLYGVLDKFISDFTDAPLIAQTTCDEIRDFRLAVSKLESYVHDPEALYPLGASIADRNHLTLTLSACVSTFSRLEKTVDRLLTRGKMDTIDRLRWSLAEATVAQLILRL